jgi:hypothetical protein
MPCPHHQHTCRSKQTHAADEPRACSRTLHANQRQASACSRHTLCICPAPALPAGVPTWPRTRWRSASRPGRRRCMHITGRRQRLPRLPWRRRVGACCMCMHACMCDHMWHSQHHRRGAVARGAGWRHQVTQQSAAAVVLGGGIRSPSSLQQPWCWVEASGHPAVCSSRGARRAAAAR